MRKTLALSIAVSSLLAAQAPPARRGGRAGAPPATPAYEDHADRTVTFKLHAPDATDVKVSGDFTQNPVTMTRGQHGAWTVTAGPPLRRRRARAWCFRTTLPPS